jgi:hypothetical protein
MPGDGGPAQGPGAAQEPGRAVCSPRGAEQTPGQRQRVACRPLGRRPAQRRGRRPGRAPGHWPGLELLFGAVWAAVVVRVGPQGRWVTQP